jgi:hypothetical protein
MFFFINLVYSVIVCYGVTMFLVQSVLFSGLRSAIKSISTKLGYLFNCMMCLGFWVSIIFLFINEISFTYTIFGGENLTMLSFIKYLIFDASAFSTLIWFLYLVQLNLERHVKHEL